MAIGLRNKTILGQLADFVAKHYDFDSFKTEQFKEELPSIAHKFSGMFSVGLVREKKNGRITEEFIFDIAGVKKFECKIEDFVFMCRALQLVI